MIVFWLIAAALAAVALAFVLWPLAGRGKERHRDADGERGAATSARRPLDFHRRHILQQPRLELEARAPMVPRAERAGGELGVELAQLVFVDGDVGVAAAELLFAFPANERAQDKK